MLAFNAVESARNWLNLLASAGDSLAKSDIMLASATSMAWAAEAILSLRSQELGLVRNLAERDDTLRKSLDRVLGDAAMDQPERARLNKLFAVRGKFVAHWDLDEAKAFLAESEETLERVPLIEEMEANGLQLRFPWAQVALKNHLFGGGLGAGSIQAEAPHYREIVGSVTRLLLDLITTLVGEIGLHGDWGPAVTPRIP